MKRPTIPCAYPYIQRERILDGLRNTKMTLQVCYWIVGLDTDQPFVAVDLHFDNGDLAAETVTRRLPLKRSKEVARMYARDYADEHGRRVGRSPSPW